MRVKTLCSAAIAATLAGACALASSQTVPSVAEPAKAVDRRGTHVWIERPWEMRYIIIGTHWGSNEREYAIKYNAQRRHGDFLLWQQFFEQTVSIPIPNRLDSDILSVVPIEFDKQGMVTTGHTHGSPLRGRLDDLLAIVLSAGDASTQPVYHLGHWFTGLGDVSTHWAPGLCNLDGPPGPFSKRDNLYRYGPKFEISELDPTFGCREWAYQLYDDERPYIDVTSYVRVGKVYPKHTAIADFIGWARFGDKKPVIGQHDGNWYCLHDCPGGDTPGAIPNIRVWAKKQGWAAPKPPTKAPTFPDPPAKQGTYPR